MSKYDVIDDLKNCFLDTSDWRLEKAVDYPNDKRNLEAAENLRAIGGNGRRRRSETVRSL